MQIHVTLADLTELPVDAIVAPTNSLGVMTHGIAAQVLQRGGTVIEQEARAYAPIAVGAAVITSGGSLFPRHVIHVPTVEEPGEKPSVENVRRATRAALIAAAKRGIDTIAIPPMSPVDGLVPDDETARAMVDELRAHRQQIPSTVWLATQKQEMFDFFKEALVNALNPG